MAKAQNGWPVVKASACVPLVVRGVSFPQGVLKGDVHYVLADVAEQWHATVERLIKAHCWGYAHRRIGDGPDWSNHAAGCAIDINAPEHPDGTPPERTLSLAQIRNCHAIERRWNGVVRWGGDWSDPDPMHWEIVGSRAEVAREVARMRGTPELSRGAKGAAVGTMQTLANRVPDTGADVNVDRVFGPLTEAKIKRVQRKGGLTADGVCGPRTWALLEGWR